MFQAPIIVYTLVLDDNATVQVAVRPLPGYSAEQTITQFWTPRSELSLVRQFYGLYEVLLRRFKQPVEIGSTNG